MADDFGNKITWSGERVQQGGREVESGGRWWYGDVPRYRTDSGFSIDSSGRMIMDNSPEEVARYHKQWDSFWKVRKIVKWGILPTLVLVAAINFKTEVLDPVTRNGEKIKNLCLDLLDNNDAENELKLGAETLIKKAIKTGNAEGQISLFGNNFKIDAIYQNAYSSRRGSSPALVKVKVYPLDLKRPAGDGRSSCDFTVNAVTGEMINPFGYRKY